MNDKIRVELLGITYNEVGPNSYVLILMQEDASHQLPIVIGTAEAQSIAIELSGKKLPRPNTHDLFISFTHGFGITLQEVFIAKYDDGIFYSEMIFSDGEREITIDSRTSDAIAIAARCNAPIYTTKEIIDEAGYETSEKLKNENFVLEKSRGPQRPQIEKYSIEELERTLSRLVEEERYEEASEINSILNQKKNK